MNKVVINHIEQVYVTSDASTIVQELQVEHPAANVVVQAAGMQQRNWRRIESCRCFCWRANEKG